MVIHTVKDFGLVNKAEVDVGYLLLLFVCLFSRALSCILYDPMDVGNLISVPLPFLNPA